MAYDPEVVPIVRSIGEPFAADHCADAPSLLALKDRFCAAFGLVEANAVPVVPSRMAARAAGAAAAARMVRMRMVTSPESCRWWASAGADGGSPDRSSFVPVWSTL